MWAVTDIVCSMLPLASASGPAIIGVVVVCAGLFLSWLLRSETGENADGPANSQGTLDEPPQPGASEPT
jgi:hypothetical protein